MGVKIATFNARGLSDPQKRRKVFEWAKFVIIDILTIQETKCKNIIKGLAWARDWGGKAYWSFAIILCSGVGILIINKTNLKVDKIELVTFSVSKDIFSCKIVCVYVHARYLKMIEQTERLQRRQVNIAWYHKHHILFALYYAFLSTFY